LFTDDVPSVDAIFKHISDYKSHIDTKNVARLLKQHKLSDLPESKVLHLMGVQLSFRDFARHILPLDQNKSQSETKLSRGLEYKVLKMIGLELDFRR
jgi:hypothetical protein